MKTKLGTKKGITLISLVITIIILLILATVAINLAVDSNGLFRRAGDAANTWNNSVASEGSTIDNLMQIANTLGGNGVEENTPTGTVEDPYEGQDGEFTFAIGSGADNRDTVIAHFFDNDNDGKFDVVVIRGTGKMAESWYAPDCSGILAPYNVEEVYVTDGVTNVGYIFGGSESLKKVYLSNSVTSIEGYAFSGCTGLTEITIPSGVTSIGISAFSGCTGLTEITIPSGVTSIEGYAFYECTGLTKITIPSSVTSIGNYAFRGCTGLTKITIPSSVTSIEDGAFAGCSGLTQITVEDGNSFYDSRDNCNAIIETSSNKLIFGCKNTTIPDSVTSIGGFRGCSGLTKIAIPSSVTSIRFSAFYYCSGLTEITIPSSVTSIEREAFAGCSKLATVYYTGTQAQWDAISKEDGNDYLLSANIICTGE